MPTYVYKCNNCEYTFEARQRMTDDPLTECPQCEEDSVRRVINSVGIVFKGKGFYVTDNRNGSNGALATGSNGSGASSTTSETKNTESGADKKTEVSSSEKSNTT